MIDVYVDTKFCKTAAGGWCHMTKLNFDLLERSDQVLVLMLILKEFQEMLWLHFLWKKLMSNTVHQRNAKGNR